MRKLLILGICILLVQQGIGQLGFTDASSSVFTEMEIYSSHPGGITDINNDGLDDVIRFDAGLNIIVGYQQEDGSFEEVDLGPLGSEEGEWGGDDAWGFAVADVDGNGMCDLLAGGWYDGIKVGLLSDDGMSMDLTYTEGNSIFVQGMCFFDINVDGHVDIFACHDDGPSEIVFNDGNGGFILDEDEVSAVLNTSLYGGGEDDSGNYGSCFTDVNNDGHCDLYIAKCRQGVTDNTDVRRINQLWIYDPSTQSYSEEGAMSGIDSGAQSWSADFGDIDNDGDMDVYIGNHDTNNMLFENDGNGVFTDIGETSGLGEVVPFATIQTAMRDFDNDGYMDVLVTGGGSHYLAMNNGDGTFTIEDDLFEYPINSFALGDLNDDGYIDILAISGGYGGSWGDADPDAILMNDGGDNNWLMVDLDGVESTPDGIGARVTIEGSFGTMIRDVKSGESYGIMNSMISHFGLGDNDAISTLTVQWPSGIVDVLTDVDVNQTVSIEEGTHIGVDEIKAGIQLEAYPNPVVNQLTVSSDEFVKNATINITDQSGRIVLSKRFSGKQIVLNTNVLASGQYNWTMNTSTEVIGSGKFVK